MRLSAKDMAIEKIKKAGIACANAFKEALFPLKCLMCGNFSISVIGETFNIKKIFPSAAYWNVMLKNCSAG